MTDSAECRVLSSEQKKPLRTQDSGLRTVCYLDYNATSPVRPEVLEAMAPYVGARFGNPNSVHFPGQQARKAVEAARAQVAELLGASPDEIVFTSGGSESDAAALLGGAFRTFDQSGGKRNSLISSRIEHEAVLGSLNFLIRRGFSLKRAQVDGCGVVTAAAVGELMEDATALVSVMHANNEVGTIQPIEEISALCHQRGVLFHSDAVQSAGKLPINVRKVGVDLLSISGHKLGAPKGIGALFIRKGVQLDPLIAGHQEKNRRGGTENVAGIVGLGKACALAAAELAHSARYEAWRNKLEKAAQAISSCRVNGHPALRLPHVSHLSFRGLDGHSLVISLDLEGVCVSSGPACSSGSALPSHVLAAMGLGPEWSKGSLRVSMGWATKESDIDRLIEVLPGAVEKLRGLETGVRGQGAGGRI